jgi:Domain of unknown function (DUF5615)
MVGESSSAHLAVASLYLDDDVTPILARLLRARGIDAIASVEAGNLGIDDEAHLEYAAGTGRVLLSYNYHDFLPLAERWYGAGREHARVLLSFHQYRLPELSIALQLTLRAVATTPGVDLRNTVRFLDEFRT